MQRTQHTQLAQQTNKSNKKTNKHDSPRAKTQQTNKRKTLLRTHVPQ